MFWKKNVVRDKLVLDLVGGLKDSHEDYTKLIGKYKKLSEMYLKLSKDHVNMVKCVLNYIECGASDTFALLLKEHAIGEEIKDGGDTFESEGKV